LLISPEFVAVAFAAAEVVKNIDICKVVFPAGLGEEPALAVDL
jgi:hypothetical protein